MALTASNNINDNWKSIDGGPSDVVQSFLIAQKGKGSSPNGVSTPHSQGVVVSDLMEMCRLLASLTSEYLAGEENLVYEMLFLEVMLAFETVPHETLMRQLSALSDELRDQGQSVDGHGVRDRLREVWGADGSATRLTAAVVLTVGSLSGTPAVAAAGHVNAGQGFVVAAAPVLRVVDGRSGSVMGGVKIKTMDERVVGVTDQNGQVTLGAAYHDSDVLSLEKDGYEMYLLDKSQLSGRNVIAMQQARKRQGVAGGISVKALTPPKVQKAVSASGHEHPLPLVLAPKAPVVTFKADTPSQAAVPHPRESVPHVSGNLASPGNVVTARQNKLVVASHAVTHDGATGAHPRLVPDLHREQASTTAHVKERQPHAMPHAHGNVLDLPVKPHRRRQSEANAQVHHASVVLELPARPGVAKTDPPAHATLERSHVASVSVSDTLDLPSRPLAVPQLVSGREASRTTPRLGQMDLFVMSLPAKPLRLAGLPDSTASVQREGAGDAKPTLAYRVRPGDTLGRIARRVLGQANRWPELYAMNRDRIDNPALIMPGLQLRVPSPENAMASTQPARRYVVRSGDCLSVIAQRVLGRSSRWRDIYETNRGSIRRPRVIFPGQTLVLPTV